jgi:hypothetical protein
MRSIEDIRRELKSALQRKDYSTTIALSREGAKRCTMPQTPAWYAFRYNLATVLLERRDPPTGRDLEEAISLFSELASLPQSADTEGERSKALLGLGRALQKRTRGDRHTNVQRAILAFTESLSYHTKSFDADTWALVKMQLGYLHCELGATTGDSEYVEAIGCFKEALQVFKASDFPAEWEEIQETLTDVEKRRGSNATQRGGPRPGPNGFAASRN